MTSPNVWIDRFSSVNSLDIIKKRTRRGAVPLTDLNSLPIDTACRLIRMEHEEIFVPTDRCCEIILEIIQTSLSYAQHYYPDVRFYKERRYQEYLETDVSPPIVLTGLAGTGKSQIAKAIMRLMGPNSAIWDDVGHREIPLVAVSRILVEERAKLGNILARLAAPEFAKREGRRNSVPSLDAMCAKWQYLIGVCLIILDEMQFLTQSESANALIAKVMLGITYVGPPALIICNFSMLHRVMKRPHEERQRLLARPIVLIPDAAGSSEWEAILAEFQLATPNLYSFNFVSVRNELWRLSAGIKRVLGTLLRLSYQRTRQSGRFSVTWKDVTDAYTSTAFSVMRKDSELLISGAFDPECLPSDLRCPLPDTSDQMRIYRESLQAARNVMVATAARNSLLTKSERDLGSAMQASQEASQSNSKNASNGKSAKGRSRATREDLLNNAERFRKAK